MTEKEFRQEFESNLAKETLYDEWKKKDQHIKELETRIAELEDKDWYEACIKQLENQNDRLIKEIEELKKDVKSQKLATDLFATIASTNATKMNIAKAVRKQVCDMARKKIVEATCYDTEEEVRNVTYDMNASTALEILDQIENELGEEA